MRSVNRWSLYRIVRYSVIFLLPIITGCATYQTPGAGVNIPNLSKSDADIRDLFNVEPAAPFPARIAIARVQASGYSSRSNQCYGSGQFCVVTTRDIEPEDSFKRIETLPQVAGLASMNRLLLPSKLENTKDIRRASATLKTDVLILYSLDTGFNVESTDIGPLALISLGFLPNKNAKVTTTASAAIIDVRTGFIYGVAEATAIEEQRATFWSSSDAIDAARRKAETNAFQKLVGEIEKLWGGVLKEYTRPRG